MKNLLIIIPTLGMGGQERVAVNTARILKEDYQVTMVVFDHRNPFYEADCEIVDLNIPAQDSAFHKVVNVFRRVWALRKLKRERKIDISFSVGMTANLTNVLSKTGDRIITRLSSYGEIVNSRIHRLVFRKSDGIICCAKESAARLIELFPNYEGKTHCVFNPFDIATILKRGAEPVGEDIFLPNTIVVCGRLNYGKNFPRAIKAIGLVRKKIPDVNLLIIGEGELRDRLMQLVSQNHLDECVTLIGHRENPFSYFKKSALYVHTTYYDGFPNSLVEAMCFVPVIAADCKSGPREILSDGPLNVVCEGVEVADYGILVKPASDQKWHDETTEDDRILANGILKLLQDPNLYETMKEKARARVESYSFQAYRGRLIEVFEEGNP